MWCTVTNSTSHIDWLLVNTHICSLLELWTDYIVLLTSWDINFVINCDVYSCREGAAHLAVKTNECGAMFVWWRCSMVSVLVLKGRLSLHLRHSLWCHIQWWGKPRQLQKCVTTVLCLQQMTREYCSVSSRQVVVCKCPERMILKCYYV